ncbi:anthranilate synthase component I family protein [Aequorivita sp. H23M31]|uniref:Anthranilate synthase component I family protein n=1 Tax=Aequorivita ciconiae TaxID=2494375 RepID=A0A410G6W6_9FLAO|nr:anthranilate synthase component I family protein [Aequorivita sp. H23M31]QAA82961.1 anthranilate synthase component I family protein [Aequorivita sp. H23M31]
MRTVKKLPLKNLETLKPKLLNWAKQFEEIIWLDGNDYSLKEKNFRAILAVDAFTALRTDAYQGFAKLKEYQNTTADWLFGYLAYDLKNDVEQLRSNNSDGLGFPDLYFFQPKKLFLFYKDYVEIQYLNMVAEEMESDWKMIGEAVHSEKVENKGLEIQNRTSKEQYVQKVNAVLEHIKKGNIYEVNLCQEFYAENSILDPLSVYIHLNEISKPPFSAFLKFNELFALCASPERYIQRNGTRVFSQPIKGTARRSKNVEEDLRLAEELKNDPKERSENIMIVDLVRNDLSRFAEKGSVKVEELCGVYSFEQVHQLISTISCQVSPDISSIDILKNTFPMGSMTGAPKISAMNIIEDVEDAKRGLYSGAIGYLTPNGNFDFNVVIRSILYNSFKKYVSFSVGGAITINSIPEKEYEECMLKARAMYQALDSPF